MLAPGANAADIAVPTKAPPVPVSSWTGWYLGINGGSIDTRSGTVNLTGTDTGAGGLGSALTAGVIPGQIGTVYSGWMVGGTAGFNYQINPLWVIGLETDFDGGRAKQSSVVSPLGVVTTTSTRTLDELGTFRGRFGMTVVAPLFVYGTGGLAFTDRTFTLGAVAPTAAPPLNAFSTASGWVAGWTAGFGMEYTFGPHWSFKGEYLYANFGSPKTSIAYAYGASTSTLTATARDSDNIVRAGVNYRF